MELNSFHHQSLDARPWQDGRWVGVVSALTRVLQHIDQVYTTRRRSFLIRRHQTASLSNSCAVSRWVATAASGSRHVVVGGQTDGRTERLTPQTYGIWRRSAQGFAFVRRSLTGLWAIKHVLEYTGEHSAVYCSETHITTSSFLVFTDRENMIIFTRQRVVEK